MKKENLRTGMRVRTRNNIIWLVVDDLLINGSIDILFANENGGWISGNSYDDNLLMNRPSSCSKDYDIMEVYTIDGRNSLHVNFLNLQNRYSIWKRQEYTIEQKEIFKALKVLGYNYLVRYSDNTIYAYELKPKKHKYYWQSNDDAYIEIETNKILNQPHLNFIKWEDTEPFEIPEV